MRNSQSALGQEVSMCLPPPEGLFSLKYITVHLCTVMSRGNICLIFKTIIDNNLMKTTLTTNYIQ